MAKGPVGPVFSRAARLMRVFASAQGERLAERAVRDGLLSSERLQEATAERQAREETQTPLIDWLVTEGLLTALMRAKLEAAEASEELSRPATSGPVPLPAEVEAALAQPERRLDDFVLVALVGRGGTGEVWRAWDRRLGRYVAVKLSLASLESASARERFEREALATARLDHPNLVPIFQVGNASGRPYLVMPHLEGDTLEVARLDARRACEVMVQVALAVDYAHQQGIVHRDLKPGNIMLDRQGRVVVLDFGLAFLRAESSMRLTRPGELVGTASYMAPEQARGDADASLLSVDVYGLGATLYFLLTGQAPFLGESFAAVVAAVTNREPEPPSRKVPGLDSQIERVVMRALEKNKANRQSTAAAFAAELGEALAGRAVALTFAQRRADWRRRLRGTGKGPRLAVRLVLSVMLLAGSATGLKIWLGHERQVALEALRDLARLSLETALRLRRAGDTPGMRLVLPRLKAAYQQVKDRGSSDAEVESLMGRMYRALLDEDKALAHQQEALALNPDFAPALYERAILQASRYGRLLGEERSSFRASDYTEKAPSNADLEQRSPALQALRTGLTVDIERLSKLPLAAPRADAVRGILAFQRRELGEARKRLSAAIAADPLMEEAWQALARTENEGGHGKAAAEIYTRALAYDQGYVPHWVGRCDVLAWVDAGQALKDAGRALELDPAATGARVCRASLLAISSHDQIMRGEDPSKELNNAEMDLSIVIASKPTPGLLLSRAVLRRYRGMYQVRRGIDPSATLDGSEADYLEALKLAPNDALQFAGLCRTRTRRGVFLADTGRLDAAEAELSRAETDCNEAMARRVGPFSAPMWRADLRAIRGDVHLRRGDLTAAGKDLHNAAEDFARLPPGRSDMERGWTGLLFGTLRVTRGLWAVATGADPLPEWTDGVGHLEQAVRGLVEHVDPHLVQARLYLERAFYLKGQGKPWHLDRARAATELTFVLDRDPQHRAAKALRDRLAAL